MSIQITIDLPEGAFSALRSSPTAFVKQMRLAAATKWYELGMVSQSKAPMLAVPDPPHEFKQILLDDDFSSPLNPLSGCCFC